MEVKLDEIEGLLCLSHLLGRMRRNWADMTVMKKTMKRTWVLWFYWMGLRGTRRMKHSR